MIKHDEKAIKNIIRGNILMTAIDTKDFSFIIKHLKQLIKSLLTTRDLKGLLHAKTKLFINSRAS